jgi:hypothetical protein
MPTVDPAIARALAEARAQAISEEHLNNVMGAQEWYLPADHPAMQLANRVAQVAPPAGGYVAAPVPGMVATQASGAHYSAPGARAGYEAAGMPPVMYQSSPYATAAFRTTMDPYGNVGVQPLVGFPSQYPHVVNGAVTDPMVREMPGIMPFMQVPAGPALQQATTPVRRAAAPAAPVRRTTPAAPAALVQSRGLKLSGEGPFPLKEEVRATAPAPAQPAPVDTVVYPDRPIDMSYDEGEIMSQAMALARDPRTAQVLGGLPSAQELGQRLGPTYDPNSTAATGGRVAADIDQLPVYMQLPALLAALLSGKDYIRQPQQTQVAPTVAQ